MQKSVDNFKNHFFWKSMKLNFYLNIQIIEKWHSLTLNFCLFYEFFVLIQLFHLFLFLLRKLQSCFQTILNEHDRNVIFRNRCNNGFLQSFLIFEKLISMIITWSPWCITCHSVSHVHFFANFCHFDFIDWN